MLKLAQAIGIVCPPVFAREITPLIDKSNAIPEVLCGLRTVVGFRERRILSNANWNYQRPPAGSSACA